MRALQRLLTRIFTDIVQGQNIEAYVVTSVAIVIAVLGIVGEALPLDIQIAAILAALAVLVFRSTVPEDDTADLDKVLLDRQSYGPLRDFVQGGRTVWVYGASAVNVLRNIDMLERVVLDQGGVVRVLLQDPEERECMDILYRQLDKIHDLDSDIEASLRILRNVRGNLRRGTLEYRLVPYSPGFSMIIVDPDGKNGRLTVEFYGFENERISERMHITIHRDQSQYWFEYWEKQYEAMWDAGREVYDIEFK